MKTSRQPGVLFATALCLTVLTAGIGRAQTVYFNVTTATGSDTIYLGGPAELHFSVYAPGIEIASLTWPVIWRFTNGNIVGPLSDTVNVFPSAQAVAAFESIAWNAFSGQGTDPDTSLYGFIDFEGSVWVGSGLVWRVTFTPTDTGTIILDSTYFRIGPAVGYPHAIAPDGGSIPSVYEPVSIHVVDSTYPQPGTVQVRVVSSYGNDSLYIGGQGSLIFTINWVGNEIAAVTFPLEATFSNGNIIGPFSEPPSATTAEFVFSPYAQSVFENLNLHPHYADNFVHAPADSILFGGTDFDGAGWTTAAEFARLRFYPLDTGTITVDEVFIPPTSGLITAIGPDAQELPLEWQPATFTVAPCPVLMGDVNHDGVVKSSDLIYMVNYIFKSGPEPIPIRAVGDVNCTGGLGGSDIIYLVNFVFKSGLAPCACHNGNF